jgi:DNA-binding Lrp family transcriptional regulator
MAANGELRAVPSDIHDDTDLLTNDYERYYSKDNDLPFFDHPLMRAYRSHPDNFKPLTTHREVLSQFTHGIIDEEDIQIVKMIGDSIAVTERQLRQIMTKAGYSFSKVSKKLNRLRQKGFVQRWKCRLENDEAEEIKPPAPFTLGIAGYILLCEIYPEHRFMRPDSWRHAAPMIQRYVSMNQLRTSFALNNVLRDWRWNVGMDYNRQLPSISGVAKIELGKKNFHFLIERAQVSQNFVGFLRSKLHKMTIVYREYKTFPLNKVNVEMPILLLSCSTLKVAEHLHNELLLDQYPFTIFLSVDEEQDDVHIDNSFYEPSNETLKPISLAFSSSSHT